jgi:hypothetical protein
VLADAGALDELLALGTRQLPVIARGKAWVNGQSLKAIAELVGIDLGTIRHLPPAELARRIDLVLDGSARFFAQFPEAHLGDLLPGRPRSYAQLAWHLFNVVDALLEHEQGIPLSPDSYNRVPAPGVTRPQILAYGADVRRRFDAWWQRPADAGQGVGRRDAGGVRPGSACRIGVETRAVLRRRGSAPLRPSASGRASRAARRRTG